MVKLFLTLLLFFTLSHAQKYTDTKNVYFTSDHFRVVSGVADFYNATIENFANKLLVSAEYSYTKLVSELGFKAPTNIDIKKVDIFIGDRKACDYNIYENCTDDYQYVSIGSGYAGWAETYETTGEPYFVVNEILKNDEELMKVTILHEFFHTIHYSYFNSWTLDESKWYANIWWLEATAMLMEDEGYDDINDYVSFLYDYITETEKLYGFFTKPFLDIETNDGWHEYSMVIFAKYLREKYGFSIIEKSFTMIDSMSSAFEILDKLLQSDYNSSMKEALKEFAIWVSNPAYYFEEGQLYPSVKRYKLTDNKSVEKGGILILNNTPDYLVKSYDNYSQTLSNQSEDIFSTSSDEIIISNFSSQSISYLSLYDNLKNSLGEYVALEKGWNLISGDISIESVKSNSCVDYIWGYEMGEWKLFTNFEYVSEFASIEEFQSQRGYWFHTKNQCILLK